MQMVKENTEFFFFGGGSLFTPFPSHMHLVQLMYTQPFPYDQPGKNKAELEGQGWRSRLGWGG